MRINIIARRNGGITIISPGIKMDVGEILFYTDEIGRGRMRVTRPNDDAAWSAADYVLHRGVNIQVYGDTYDAVKIREHVKQCGVEGVIA